MRKTVKQQSCAILSPSIPCFMLLTTVSLLVLGSPRVVAAGQRDEAVANNMQERDTRVGSNACCDYEDCVQVPKHLPTTNDIP